mgnify:FL=1
MCIVQRLEAELVYSGRVLTTNASAMCRRRKRKFESDLLVQELSKFSTHKHTNVVKVTTHLKSGFK